jgi:hypothetical protein
MGLKRSKYNIRPDESGRYKIDRADGSMMTTKMLNLYGGFLTLSLWRTSIS